MTISQRLTRAALAFLLFGLLVSLIPNTGMTMASASTCPNADPGNHKHR